ncbi:transcription initiation factor IIF, beta subunit [Artomyces pyxidatus]|uniref:Transcription initiation factor IIF, beta subunit n=1 Tax=Artomyces pyxidatus TaxID=48021 RepID=A0ACB8SS80_9AGAM|nr:transcription initiation factor IIF, beta subunit [Artomyces pyxidatus]
MDEDVTLEDEKKPFDAVAGNEDDSQPDPEEQIMLDSGNGRVWLVKIPRFLMERWSAIDEEGRQLATIRIYDAPPNSIKPPRIFVQIPSDPANPAAGTDQYEMAMNNQDVNNQIVVAEREKEPHSRARTTIMTGKVKHECNLRPTFNDAYRQLMKNRSITAGTPQKHIKMIDGAVSGGRGSINRLSSGINTAQGFGDHIMTKSKPVKGAFERMARMPRNQLLDMLFSLYREREQWPIKLLREKTQQPEVYLKEVLNEIAVLHRSGEFNGTWELKPSFKEEGIKGENVPESSETWKAGDATLEGDDDEDDEDDDMEEVS